ncbi:MAG: radical SAM protein [Bacteroidales bacterium]|jgi:putative pyruvate formate lyase activating enzyme|nr:radical SAM protein [Bacteroidales bacterium]MDD2204212.1 radical SAM protein [Bacteroidales bacterium]MDD3152859.1 radical SAM protein [Bacteroidales bacterium]MDD3913615.1 radical SAM protein [Bacteroidales bacterium]MDD4633617.1 radical SAM protein [Bacteroidales bacterium]
MLCNNCYRKCNVDRTLKTGFCKIDDKIYVSAICIHKGEEPVIVGKSGICNVFFDHCNLQCIYCQNYQISCNNVDISNNLISADKCVEKIKQLLDSGTKMLGLVSPTPYVDNIYEIVNKLNSDNYFPRIVYNTNAYDTVEIIKKLKDIVDIYLPDYKYGSYDLCKSLSNAPDYPDTALEAIKEMYKQKGRKIILDEDNLAVSGLIIRHLVLPGHVENSKSALFNIAFEISNKVNISLMSQYYPVYKSFEYPELSRKLTAEEYNEVLDYMSELGLENGWIQEVESSDCYKPDFTTTEVFK